MKWPLDPPLSDKGLEAAKATAERLNSITEGSGVQIHVIISSPYYRCIQTAVEIARGLKHRTRLLIDRSLGEIFGPSVMGTNEPTHTVRPIEHTRAYCQSRGVCVHTKLIGKWPTWPEHLRDARKRFAVRFLTYLHRSAVAKRNFMLVTHADGVAATVGLMPSEADNTVEAVDYGGLFYARRQCKESSSKSAASKGGKQRRNNNFVSITPCDDVDLDSEGPVCEPMQFLADAESSNSAFDEFLNDEPSSSSNSQIQRYDSA